MDEGTPATPTPIETPTTQEAAPAKRPVWLYALIAVLVMALGIGGWFAYDAWATQRDAKTAISRASALLEDAEADLLLVDEAVQVEISSVTATQSAEAADAAGDVHGKAVAAARIIEDALDDLPEDQLALANALKESADARAEMMAIAPTILEADGKAARAIVLADQAVAEIKNAESLSAQAAAEFNKHTAEGVRASDAISIQAETQLGVAASLLTSATAAFPGADFTAFKDYIDAKVGLIALAKEIDALWIAGDIAGSNSKLAAYNQREAEIVALAQALPASVRDPIANAYNAETKEAMTEYFEARERARLAGERVSKLRQAVNTSD
jgi:hypothetical protein